MTQLAQQHCEACRADSPPVKDTELSRLHPEVPEWEIVKRDGTRRLERTFRFDNFAAALEFTDRVGSLAEAEGHHPSIVTEWGRVTVTWWTHAIRDLHVNDFVMAAKTDQAYADTT